MNEEAINAIADFGRLMSGVRATGNQKMILVPIATAKLVHRVARKQVIRHRNAQRKPNHKNRLCPTR